MAQYLHQPQLKYLYHDIIFLSETAVGLQNQLNILHRSSEKLQLKVNSDKSNIIIVFQKGGYLAAQEKMVLWKELNRS